MGKSESIIEISKALLKFQSIVHPIPLNSSVSVITKKGGKYNFKYATLRHIIDTIKPSLNECGLSFSHLIETDGTVVTFLFHNSGEYLSSSLLINTEETTAQAIGSCITYAKRYTLTAILGIIAEDDDDGNGADGNQFSKGSLTTPNDDKREWLNPNTEKWDKAVEVLKNGKYTIQQIEDKYKISKENRIKLLEQAI